MTIDTSGSLFDTINNIISAAVTILSLIGIAAYFIFTAIKNHKKHGFGRGAYFSAITLFLLQFPLWGIILLPEWLVRVAAEREEPFLAYMPLAALRWFALYAVLLPLVFIMTWKFSKFKSTLAACGHLSIFLLGWLQGKWFGIIFISIPILAIFYFLLYHLAPVIFPSSEPENKEESRNKVQALFWYVWGAQYPFWAAKSSATREIEKRIDGSSFKGFGRPGITWMHSHQVIGQSVGVEFKRVDGPGIVFSEQYERPIAIVDLRTQLRTETFDAVTKDGISIKAVVFTSFKIDQDDWSEWNKEDRHRVWRVSPILQNGTKVDREIGCYPYSTARVHAALSATSIGDLTEEEKEKEEEKAAATEEEGEEKKPPKFYWDQIVVQRVVKEARLVLSERTFDELWTPKEDFRGASALDEIGADVKEKASPRLQELGVQLLGARVVNYIIDKDDPVREQLASTWTAA